MVQIVPQREGETPSTKPLVAFLGPPSSFTHQVRVLITYCRLIPPPPDIPTHSLTHSHPHGRAVLLNKYIQTFTCTYINK